MGKIKQKMPKGYKINVKGVGYKMPASQFLKTASKMGINGKKGKRMKSRRVIKRYSSNGIYWTRSSHHGQRTNMKELRT